MKIKRVIGIIFCWALASFLLTLGFGIVGTHTFIERFCIAQLMMIAFILFLGSLYLLIKTIEWFFD